MKFSGVMALELTQFFLNFNFVRSKTQTVFIVCGYNILPKFVNQPQAYIYFLTRCQLHFCTTIRAYLWRYGHSCW